jgi:hypothetical protein
MDVVFYSAGGVKNETRLITKKVNQIQSVNFILYFLIRIS